MSDEIPFHKFEMMQNEDLDMGFVLVDGSGAAKTLAGATVIRFRLAGNARATEDLITKNIGDGVTVTNEPGGLFTATLDRADVKDLHGGYYFQVFVIDAADRKKYVAHGIITIKRTFPEIV